MRLKDVIKGLDYKATPSFPGDIEIKGITCDSRLVKKDYLFIAVNGVRADGHKFIREAVKRGAAAVILEKKEISFNGIVEVCVHDSRAALAKIAAEFYGRPFEKLINVGITGTNGKTTISYLMDSIISESGHKSGLIGTINYKVGRRVIPATNTTPGPVELFSLMDEMVRDGADYMVMEVSSHSLDQRRTEGIGFSAAIFTNLTGDHLDYHKTLEGYFNAKARLFEELNAGAYGIINIDDGWGEKLLRRSRGRIITYGLERRAYIRASDIKFSLDGTSFTIEWPDGRFEIKTKLIGAHNVYNITASFAAALALGFSPDRIASGIERLTAVPGRLEAIDCGQSFKVFVDYAHTDDALHNVLSALRPLIQGKMITVFGCGGERDKLKRPRMGKTASSLSDSVIITSDNPRSEAADVIADDILSGIDTLNYTVILDRADAIRHAFRVAREGDCVLVAGKGHETYQVLKDAVITFDDREIARKILSFN